MRRKLQNTPEVCTSNSYNCGLVKQNKQRGLVFERIIDTQRYTPKASKIIRILQKLLYNVSENKIEIALFFHKRENIFDELNNEFDCMLKGSSKFYELGFIPSTLNRI